MELQLKEIVGYLPYNTKVLNGWGDVKTLNYTFLDDENNGFITNCKPILFPLSLFKDINSDAMNDLGVDLENQMELCDLANAKIGYWHLQYSTIEICLENKIDFQSLIGRGLAIEVTENFNPYL
jgi:hypothetical protein